VTNITDSLQFIFIYLKLNFILFFPGRKVQPNCNSREQYNPEPFESGNVRPPVFVGGNEDRHSDQNTHERFARDQA
jgi:hypothetical protein